MTGRTTAETAAILTEALRFGGLQVGVDDTLRLMQVLAHAADWPAERRVRAVKALLGRSETDRATIEEVATRIWGGRLRPSCR